MKGIMTDNEIIANLARENMFLKEEKKLYKSTLESIDSYIFCIGGPLNDNVLKYNTKQLQFFIKLMH